MLAVRTGPGRAAVDVIAGLDDDIVGAEVGAPRVPARGVGRRRRGGHVDGEKLRRFDDPADQRSREAPVVIAETVDDEDADLRSIHACGGDAPEKHEDKESVTRHATAE